MRLQAICRQVRSPTYERAIGLDDHPLDLLACSHVSRPKPQPTPSTFSVLSLVVLSMYQSVEVSNAKLRREGQCLD